MVNDNSEQDPMARHYAKWERRNRNASGLRRRGEEEKARKAREREAYLRNHPEPEPIVLDGGGVLHTEHLPEVPTAEEMDQFLGESHTIPYPEWPGFD